jgi:hypothetical protein
MAVRHDRFDVAVIDINLRGDSAYPIADELIRLRKPFVFPTGHGPDSIPDRFRHVQRWKKLTKWIRSLPGSPNCAVIKRRTFWRFSAALTPAGVERKHMIGNWLSERQRSFSQFAMLARRFFK